MSQRNAILHFFSLSLSCEFSRLLLILASSTQMFQAQPKPGEGGMAPQPPAPRPKVRARRGQATDPHSIAERVNT